MTMSKKIDIVDVMLAVKNGELKVTTFRGYYILEHISSGECVRLNKVEE
jgi:hypothetical protein